jgi:phospholipid-binding lipoprotein MlaA
MGRHGRRATRLFLGLTMVAAILFAGMIAGVPARAALAPHVVAALERSAYEAAVLVQTDSNLAANLNNPELAAIMISRATDRAADSFSATVVGLVAQNPAQAQDILAVANGMAPQYRNRFAYDVARAFPGLAGGYAAPTVQFTATTYDYAAPTNAPVYAATTAAPTVDYASDMGDMDGGGDADMVYDPIEPFNRAVFFVNDQFDTYLMRPLAFAYGWVTPEPVRLAVRRAFVNLGSPARFANDLLQGEVEDAGETGARFLINSSVGIAGLFDVAEDIGLPHHPSDFGQTLHSYGVDAGPYIMVPIMGPTTLRDGAGGIVDTVFDPFTYMLDTWPEGLALDAGEGLVKREELFVVLDDTKANSVDYYAGIQALYYQNRAVDLRRGAAADSTAFDDEFASFE